MNAKLSLLAIPFLLGLSVAPIDGSLRAQDEKVVETSGKKARGEESADANIKTRRAANDPAASVPAPASKSGEKSATMGCTVHVDNRTSLYIDVYLDGDFRGTVGPWGDLNRSVICGGTRLYARANYTDGSYSSWGPQVESVLGTHTWRLWL
jgi:hypothetical protein